MYENLEKNAAAKIFGPLPLAHLLAHHSEHLGCQTPIRNLIYMTGFIYPLHSDLAFAKSRYVICIYLKYMYTNIFGLLLRKKTKHHKERKQNSQVAINNPFRWIFILCFEIQRCRGCLDIRRYCLYHLESCAIYFH